MDGTGQAQLHTGIGFLDHMLEQIAKHALVDLKIECQGDLHIDDHHSVEDIGICLGQALLQAVGDKKGICRYGYAYAPLDEALARCVIDLSGRSHLTYKASFSSAKIGQFDSELIEEFFVAVAHNAKMTLHVHQLEGSNSHHIAETQFKAFAQALRQALSMDPRNAGQIPSSKGAL